MFSWRLRSVCLLNERPQTGHEWWFGVLGDVGDRGDGLLAVTVLRVENEVEDEDDDEVFDC